MTRKRFKGLLMAGRQLQGRAAEAAARSVAREGISYEFAYRMIFKPLLEEMKGCSFERMEITREAPEGYGGE